MFNWSAFYDSSSLLAPARFTSPVQKMKYGQNFRLRLRWKLRSYVRFQQKGRLIAQSSKALEFVTILFSQSPLERKHIMGAKLLRNFGGKFQLQFIISHVKFRIAMAMLGTKFLGEINKYTSLDLTFEH